MDSFELSTDTYDAAELKRGKRNKPLQPDDFDSPSREVNEDYDVQPLQQRSNYEQVNTAKTAQSQTQRTTARSRQTAPIPEEQPRTVEPKTQKREVTVPVEPFIKLGDGLRQIRDFFTSDLFGIFCGVVLLLVAAYMLLASISYIANSAADQSLLVNTTTEALKNNAPDVKNTTGWVGAWLSHFIVYRWLGVGAFVVIFYIAALGLGLVKLCRFNFVRLTFKSLVSSVAISLIFGLATYYSESATFWGGEHGYYINKAMIDNASLWSAIAVSIMMLTALILIFIRPVSYVSSALWQGLKVAKSRLAQRHDAAMEAAHRTEVRYRAEKEIQRTKAEERRAAEEAAASQRVAEMPKMSIDEALSAPIVAPKPKPAPLDEIYTPLTPTATITDVDDRFHGNPHNNASTEVTPVTKSEPDTPTNSETFEPVNHPVSAVEHEEIDTTPTDNSADSVQQLTEEEKDIVENKPTEAAPASISLSLSAPGLDSTSISLDSSLDNFSASYDNEDSVHENNEDAEKEEDEDDNDTMRQGIEESHHVNERDYEHPVSVEHINIETPPQYGDNCYDPTAELSHYKFPPIELLKEIKVAENPIDEQEQEANKERIINILRSYGVEIASITATIGPTITLYEIVPAPGVRIAKIKRLGDDVALNLSAMGIRIIAPIPGKGTIGMEVPNKKPQIVSMRSIITSRAFRESKAQLPMALGTTISNEIYVADLAKMPHLLVAGATGMGKSVGLNTIITSLLYRKHPAELKFVLVDPKMVEFSLYKCIERHYLAKLPDEDEKAIITDPLKVVATLNSLCIEMDNRYALLSEAGMRGIKEYNERFIARQLNPSKGHRYLPYIVVVIDEFADLILTAGKDVETPISRIAAKARAVGIHMILATQRPSVNVITGVIKANFPGRMAFRVTQRNDSQTILDRPGAEQLIGRGDMLISRDGVIDRVQCAFIDTPEVEAICNHIAHQQAYPSAYELPEVLTTSESSGNPGALSDRDPLFAEAGREVIAQGIGSASSLQRKLNIGYPRAGKLIDQLEVAGVVGPAQGGKPRAILMDMYSFERLLES